MTWELQFSSKATLTGIRGLRLGSEWWFARAAWRLVTKILEIKHGSSHYEDALKLRECQLRSPLGLTLDAEDVKDERCQVHFGVLHPVQGLCGCVVLLIDKDISEARLRQMTVESRLQGGGVGRKLFDFVEAWCLANSISQITLNARVVSKGFYQKLGFSECGSEFNHITLPHIRMSKSLWRSVFRLIKE